MGTNERNSIVPHSKIDYNVFGDKSFPSEDFFRRHEVGQKHRNIDLPNDLIKTKINIILVILSFCVICAVILSFVNSSDDFEEMNNFYHGYMGRRLLIQERRLVYRGQVDRINKSRAGNQSYYPETYSLQTGVKFIKLEESLSPMTTTTLLPPVPDTTWLEPSLPGMQESTRFVEDEEPEWRELDYLVEVGKPPSSFCSFIRQYDWNLFTMDGLSTQGIEEQKNLLNQFRKWKKRKRKTFNIVVTERAKREMAEQEEEKNKKRTPPSK